VAVPALSFEQARQLAMYLNGLLDRSRGRDVALVAYVKEFLPRSEDRFVAVENGLARIRELPPAPAGYGEFGAGRAA
jgi:hypothetical protein